ncbi:MAG: 3-hydroxybenzoate 6-monooxygenase [Proteobacteria bacterium]|nr:3-hydroxybenzoate 6-monooxygenase [Pseudomonadota bacterium]
MNKIDPILIAGGGIGGLACARALALKGYRSIVLEQAAQFGEIGAGIQLGPNVDRAFDRLEVRPAMRDIAFYPQNIIMMDSLTREEVTRIPLGSKFERHFGNPYGVIHRGDLHKVLLEACQGMAEIALHAGTEVTSYDDDGTAVTVQTASGGSFTGAALIAADGLWSKIRRTIIDDGDPIVSGHIAYRAVLPIDDVPPELDRWMEDIVLWGGPRSHLVHYKLRRGELFNIVAVFHSQKYVEGWDEFGDPEELRHHFDGASREVQALLDKINVWKMWVLCDRKPAREWSKGRVTLIGDAAHPMLQYLAAGAGMAMEDSVCLADLLEQHDGDIKRVFADFPAQRYLRTGRVQLTARFYGDIYHAEGVTAELRNLMLGGRDPSGAYKGVEWLYKQGSGAPGGN